MRDKSGFSFSFSSFSFFTLPIRYDDGTLVAVREKYSTASAKHFTQQSEESIKAMLVEGAEKKETLKQLLNRKLGESSGC